MVDGFDPRTRYGEAFWRTHHEAWRDSTLNQREYCELHGLPLKRFENWRAQFKAEPQPPERKLLYRRGGLSHTFSHRLSHRLSHMTNDVEAARPIVPPPRNGHRRKFTDADKRRIVAEAERPNVGTSEAARRYGIAPRVLFRWKQELAMPTFVDVEIADASVSREEAGQ